MLDNIGADAVNFSDGELQERNAALAETTIRGGRLPPAVLVFSGAEAPLQQRYRSAFELTAPPAKAEHLPWFKP
jgi:hypothetical protein